MIIGITGLLEDSEGNTRVAGAGKDAVADILMFERSGVKVALADPLKRIVRDVYEFSFEQLWGPSELRNAPDFRYPNGAAAYRDAYEVEMRLVREGIAHLDETNKRAQLALSYARLGWLTPRFALQQLGTEWGRRCYANTWIDLCLRTANTLLTSTCVYTYTPDKGLERADWSTLKPTVVAIPDVRFFNEHKAIKAQGGKVIRVKRKYVGVFDDAVGTDHQSEKEVTSIGDNDFDYVIENYSTLDVLKLNTLRMFDALTGRIMKFDEEQADVPPFMRKPR